MDWKKKLRPGSTLFRAIIAPNEPGLGGTEVTSRVERYQIILFLLMTFIILLFFFTPDILLREFNWPLGQKTDRDILAPFSFSVENREETERLRRAAEETAPIVFRWDHQTDDRILQDALSILSTAQQISIRENLTKDEKLNLLSGKIGFPISDKSAQTLLRYPQYRQLRETLQAITLLIDTTPLLSDASYMAAQQGANIQIWSEESRQFSPAIQYIEKDMKIIPLATFRKYLDQLIAKNLPLREDEPARQLARELMEHLLQANMVVDTNLTTKERSDYRRHVRPVIQTVYQGEVIVPANTVIKPNQKRILDELTYNRLKYGFSIILGRAVILLLFGYFAWLYMNRYYSRISHEFHNLAPVCTLLVIMVGLTKLTIWMGGSPYLIPIASFAMLAGILFEIRFALLMTTEFAVFLGVMLGLEVRHILIFLVSGTVASFSVARILKRTDLVKTGLLVSLVNVISITAIFLYDHPLFSTYAGKWGELGKDVASGAANGLICYAITVGFLPLFEWVFNLTTDVKFLEYSDPNAPILTELQEKAPGTYQHSLTVGQLAESAALAIGANALLCRIGGYYQDIGKIDTPEYFTENQTTDDERKRHDKLSPHMSCLVIKNHVKQGIELAKKSNLPPPVVDIIAQHHGTTLINFFYFKAQEMKEENGDTEEINEQDFRYPGPKPKTTEAAIVMLADSVEAAVASIPNPSAGAIQTMVRKVVNDKFTDEQLDECDITLRDLHEITENLVKTLLSKYHRRIEYPENEPAKEVKKNGR